MASVKVNITAAQLIAGIKVSPTALVEISEFWVKRVQGVTRSGKNIETGKPLKELSGTSAFKEVTKQFGAENRSIAKMNRDIQKEANKRRGRLAKFLKRNAKVDRSYQVSESLRSQFGKEQGLDRSYIGFRMRYKGPKGIAFSPQKSNLTLTGQLLASLKGSPNVRLQRIQLSPTGGRTDGLTNIEVAGHVADNGRPFLGLDDKGRARMVQIVLRDLRRTLRKRRQ